MTDGSNDAQMQPRNQEARLWKTACQTAEAERDQWRQRESETQEALQKLGEQYGVHGGEPRVSGIARLLAEAHSIREAAGAVINAQAPQDGGLRATAQALIFDYDARARVSDFQIGCLSVCPALRVVTEVSAEPDVLPGLKLALNYSGKDLALSSETSSVPRSPASRRSASDDTGSQGRGSGSRGCVARIAGFNVRSIWVDHCS